LRIAIKLAEKSEETILNYIKLKVPFAETLGRKWFGWTWDAFPWT
jgi:hypothetical protein